MNNYQYNENPYKKLSIEEENLEKLKFIILHELPPGISLKSVDFSEHVSFIRDTVMMRVSFCLLGKELKPIKLKWPLTWWEHFKERHFPGWLKKKYPVKYTRVEITPRLFYPNMKGNVPRELAAVDLDVKYKS